MGAAETLGGSIHNRLKHALRIVIKLVVPDAKNNPSFAAKIIVPTPVRLGLGVVSAVQLDDQLYLPASEVGHIRTDRQLARKFRPQTRDYPP